jgi:hypothetical protein
MLRSVMSLMPHVLACWSKAFGDHLVGPGPRTVFHLVITHRPPGTRRHRTAETDSLATSSKPETGSPFTLKVTHTVAFLFRSLKVAVEFSTSSVQLGYSSP